MIEVVFVMAVRLLRFALLAWTFLVVGVSFAQSRTIQVFGDPGLVIRVDGQVVGSVTSEAGGLPITDVRVGDRLVEALKAGQVIIAEVVSV